MLQGIRRSAHLGPLLAYDAGHQQPAVLEVVCRRSAQRLLQLRRSPPGNQSQQGGFDLGTRAGNRRDQSYHLSGTLCQGQ